ncbi:MAG: outer membrane channel protein TolC, partial [Plesiomonas shigelloides]
NRAPLLPTVSASVGYGKTWQDPAQDTNGFTGGLSLSQMLYDHSAWVGLSLAEKAATQADATYASTLQNLIIRVSTAYFNVLKAQDNYELKGAQKRAFERQLEQTKQRFAVGLTAITDVYEAQAQYDLSGAQEIQAENTLANSYQALTLITGIQHHFISVLDTKRFSAVGPTPAIPNDWIKMAESNSKDLLSQRIGKDIAEETISLNEAGHYPTLSLNAGYNKGFDQTPGPDFDNGSLGVNLSVPIFQGFRISAQVEQAQYNYVIASEKLEQTYRQIVSDVRSNFNNVGASISSIKAYEQSVVSAESALNATEAGFEVGTRTIVDVLNSTSTLYNAKSQLSDARYSYINSVLALKQAAGTLNEDDIIAINNGLIAPPKQ